MTALWTLSDMARAMRADTTGTPASDKTRKSNDTRTNANGEA